MPDHPLTAIGGAASLYVQETEPTETPQPAPNGDGGIWYPVETTQAGDREWKFTSDDITGGVAVSNEYAVFTDSDTAYYVDTSDGSLVWSNSSNDAGAASTRIYVDNGLVFYGTAGGLFIAHSESTGDIVFDNDLQSSYGAEWLTYSNGVAAVGYDRDVSGYDIPLGTSAFDFRTDTELLGYNPASTTDKVIYPDGTSLKAYSKTNKTEDWSFSADNKIRSDTVVVDGVAVFGEYADLYGVDITDGTQVWNFDPGSFEPKSLTSSNGTVFVAGEDGTVLSVTASDGTINWEVDVSNSISERGITFSNGVVYFWDFNGNLYARSSSDGSELWTKQVTEINGSNVGVTNEVVIAGLESGVIALAEKPTSNYGTPKFSDGTEWVGQ